MSMRHTFKVASWEIKRNMKNKSFIIGLFLTPIIIALFMIVPSLFGDSEPDKVDVFIDDELNIFDDLKKIVNNNDFLYWDLHETNLSKANMIDQLASDANMAYFSLTESTLAEGTVKVYTTDDIDDSFMNQIDSLNEPLRQLQLKQLGFSEDQVNVISRGIAFQGESVGDEPVEKE